MKYLKRYWTLSLLMFGCAGTARSCASCNAEAYGADWVVVQTGVNGQPYRCWTLRNTSISNEEHSDGIYRQESTGNLVHISNHYNRVQVINGNWDAAYRELGLTRETCATVAGSQYDFNAGSYATPNSRPRGTVTLDQIPSTL